MASSSRRVWTLPMGVQQWLKKETCPTSRKEKDGVHIILKLECFLLFQVCKSISKDFAFEVCIWVIYQKNSKKDIQWFCIWSLQFGQLVKWGSKLGKKYKLWTALQTRSREQSHARGKRAPGDLLFYHLPTPNVNSLVDDLFLLFAFCYGSLQTTTNAKLICQSLWRCSKRVLFDYDLFLGLGYK